MDEGIAPLVLALWRRGFRTISSCEHAPGTRVGWIGFKTRAEASRAARLTRGELLVPTPEDFAGASRASVEAGYTVPGSAGVMIPTDGILEAAERVRKARQGAMTRKKLTKEHRRKIAKGMRRSWKGGNRRLRRTKAQIKRDRSS